jgi:hypothetical protein
MKRTPLKRKGRKPMTKTEREARRLFERVVLHNGHGRCILHADSDCAGPLDAHHVIPKQRLKQRPGLSKQERMELVWDARNGVPACRKHHGLLTTHARKLTPEQVPVQTICFAVDRDLIGALERELSAPLFPESSANYKTDDLGTKTFKIGKLADG